MRRGMVGKTARRPRIFTQSAPVAPARPFGRSDHPARRICAQQREMVDMVEVAVAMIHALPQRPLRYYTILPDQLSESVLSARRRLQPRSPAQRCRILGAATDGPGALGRAARIVSCARASESETPPV